MPAETIKVKVEFPRIEIALGSVSDLDPGPGPYVAVAMLHLPEGEAMFQPLMPKAGREGSPHLNTEAAADFLAEIYDFICERWGS